MCKTAFVLFQDHASKQRRNTQSDFLVLRGSSLIWWGKEGEPGQVTVTCQVPPWGPTLSMSKILRIKHVGGQVKNKNMLFNKNTYLRSIIWTQKPDPSYDSDTKKSKEFTLKISLSRTMTWISYSKVMLTVTWL